MKKLRSMKRLFVLCQEMGSYSYAPKNIYLDLVNRPTPVDKPSIEDLLVLELKELPGHLRYMFW